MLLPRKASEIEPLFQFYRVGWAFAKNDEPLPKNLSCPNIDEIELMFHEYDLQAGYHAYLHRQQRRQQYA